MRTAPTAAAPAPLSVLHVVAPCEAGGLERVVQALALGHVERGHDVRVAAILEPPADEHQFLNLFRETEVPVYPLSIPHRAYRQEREAVCELAQRLGSAIVHTHGYRADVVDAGAVRTLGLPTVTTVHGFTGGDLKNRFYEGLQRVLFRRFDAVVAVSRPLAEQLARGGVSPRRLHLVPNAWGEHSDPQSRASARDTLRLPADAFVIGWVGRLGREKGPDVLLEALGFLPEREVVVAMIGTGAERERLEAQARRSGVAERVRWYGLVPEAGRLFTAFDVFVSSSRTEGTPIVVFEAMAAGVPIVATAVGGIPDVLSPAEALLVEPDDPRGLAAALRAIAAEPDAATTRANAARRRLEREFGREVWLDRYEAIYRHVLFPSGVASS